MSATRTRNRATAPSDSPVPEPVAPPERLPSVLIMTHSHPKLTRGGAEISALTLFRELKARGVKAWFIGVAGARSEERLGATFTQPYGADDYVYHPSAPFDYFKFANPDPQFPQAIEELVAELQPDIVHTHHFVRFGVEMFSAIRRGSPKTKIVLSLHEYLAICNHHGQMMKTRTLRLCEQESYAACAACFPELGQRDFFLRKRYIQMFFNDVDLFVSPSYFLAERFRAWGLPESKLAVLENMPPERAGSAAAEMTAEGWPKAPERAPVIAPILKDPSSIEPLSIAGSRTSGQRTRRPASQLAARPVLRELRFGFFGQMSPLKGITVLMDAARRLTTMGITNAVIEIYGDYSSQPLEFQEIVKKELEEAGENVVYHGAYDNADVNKLMRKIDAMIIPSTWWENSPVVIQEAFLNGKPVICSNIGGMAEKIVHGVNGLHFEVSRPASLAETLAELAMNPDKLATLTAGVKPPPTARQALDDHLRLYARVWS